MSSTPSSSRVEMTQIVMPQHTNGVGGVLFGGVIVQWIDVCAGVAAMRHARGPAVTASIDRLDFLSPIQVGDIVILQSQVNFVHRTSMEVGCRVETEDPRTRARRYTTKAYLTFVAVDENGRPREVPRLVPETDVERRRHSQAQARREQRLATRLRKEPGVMGTPVLVNQSDWGTLRVSGPDRERFLQGMLSNDLAQLAPGGFMRATLLNVKGHVLAVVDVVREGDDYLVLSEPVVADKVREVLDRHAIADDVTFAPETRTWHRIWEAPAAVWTAPPLPGPPPGPVDAAAVEVRRVEAGLPRYGVDVTEENFPFEANLDSALNHTKGCYIGQEVVARVTARGKPSKRLVGLRLAGEGPVAAGTAVTSPESRAPGAVTSSVVSPDFGPIALAYVPRKIWDAGTAVRAGDRDAVVTDLPFG